MVQTIGNPASWGAKAVHDGARALGDAAQHMRSDMDVHPRVHSIGVEDLWKALLLGVRDFSRFRSDVIALVVIYPMIGVLLAAMAFERAMVPFLFPMVSGFALIGPVAAVGLYAMSALHEDGQEASWADALAMLRVRAIGPVLVLGLYLFAMFFLWMAAAYWVYSVTLGPAMPQSVAGFMRDVFTTSDGWTMIWMGCGIGAVFAFVVLVTALTSFPMLLDRPVGLPTAVVTSLRVASKNPLPVVVWGMIVAGMLVLGAMPAFLGMIFVLPILGHATWHLYRMAVSFD